MSVVLKALSPRDPRRVLEALLFIGAHPVTWERMERCLPGLTRQQFEAAVHATATAYRLQRRPYEVRRTPRGVILRLHQHQATDLILQTRSEKGAKLSRAVVETLSIVAYRQPITRAEIEKMTATDVGPALRQLVRRRLLEVQEGSTASDAVYVTSTRFLEMFGLETLDDLPTMEETI